MGKPVTLYLHDGILARARDVADRSERDVEDVLAEWLTSYVDDLPVEHLPDDEILLLCEYELHPLYQYELRHLLNIYHYRPLTRDESVRLDELLRIYRRGIIRKAAALRVAMTRGLRSVS